MHIGIIHSGAALHLEWYLDVLNQLVVDPEIEVVHVAAPVAGGGDDAVSPASVGIVLFLIVQEIGIKFPHDVVFVAKYEESGRGGMLLSIGANTNGAKFQEEIFILKSLPNMTGTGQTHSLAVAADALFVEYGHIHFI